MVLALHRLLEIDHVVDERSERRRNRTRPGPHALDLLTSGRPLDAASLGTEPSLNALQIPRRGAEARPELLRPEPAPILGAARILLCLEERTQRWPVPPTEPDVDPPL